MPLTQGSPVTAFILIINFMEVAAVPRKPAVSKRPGGNDSRLPDKDVKLTGSERFFIQHAIEKVPAGQRTAGETRLLAKVRG